MVVRCDAPRWETVFCSSIMKRFLPRRSWSEDSVRFPCISDGMDLKFGQSVCARQWLISKVDREVLCLMSFTSSGRLQED
jgi:hypothetical protein